MGTKINFLVHLIPFAQLLLPGLELGKEEETAESETWEGRNGKKGGRYNREEDEKPGIVEDGQPAR